MDTETQMNDDDFSASTTTIQTHMDLVDADFPWLYGFRYVRLMIPNVEPTSVEQLVQKNVRFN